METVTKSVVIGFGDATKYVATKGTNVYVDADLLSIPATIALYKALNLTNLSEKFTFNADFMAELYPSEYTHPTQFDYYMKCGAQPQNATATKIVLQIDNNTIFTDQSFSAIQGVEKTHNGITTSAVTSSTRASTIAYTFSLGRSNLLASAVGVNEVTFTMYFIKYDMNVLSIGNGVKSITKSADELYKGDTVTLTANLKDGAEWHGWYSDANHTNLVSTSQTYTISNANADVTLYAYADKEVKPVIKSATVTPNPVDIGGTVLVSIGVDLE